MLVVRHYFVGTMLKHLGSNVAHDGMGLDMEVSQHDLGLPTVDGIDDTVIELCSQECYATASTQGAG
jgi:hypothetical protein